jgi:hypothetical protein
VAKSDAYGVTMYVMAALLLVGLLASLRLRALTVPSLSSPIVRAA